jgi:hypothetical protein
MNAQTGSFCPAIICLLNPHRLSSDEAERANSNGQRDPFESALSAQSEDKF